MFLDWWLVSGTVFVMPDKAVLLRTFSYCLSLVLNANLIACKVDHHFFFFLRGFIGNDHSRTPQVLVCCVTDHCLYQHTSAETSEERQAFTSLSWIFTLLLSCEALSAFSFTPLTVTHPQQAGKISRAVGNLRLARDRWQLASRWMRSIKESKKSNKKNVHSPKHNDLLLSYCVFQFYS